MPRRRQNNQIDDEVVNYSDRLSPRHQKKKKKKKKEKRNHPSNYRLITYLPMMWKILCEFIREEIYYLLECCGLFWEESKRCGKGTSGTDDLLYID